MMGSARVVLLRNTPSPLVLNARLLLHRLRLRAIFWTLGGNWFEVSFKVPARLTVAGLERRARERAFALGYLRRKSCPVRLVVGGRLAGRAIIILESQRCLARWTRRGRRQVGGRGRALQLELAQRAALQKALDLFHTSGASWGKKQGGLPTSGLERDKY